MRFKDCKFRNKREVRKNVKHDILGFLKRELSFSDYNEGLVLEYIDLLLDETDYDFKSGVFYKKVNWVRIDLPIKLLKNVSLDYIKEHRNDFLLEKVKEELK